MKKLWFLFGAFVGLASIASAGTVASNGTVPPNAVETLMHAHDLMDSERAEDWLRALEMLDALGGHIMAPDGRPADLGYDALYIRLFEVLEQGDKAAELGRRFAELPAPMRGNALGWSKAEAPALPVKAHAMIFNARETASIYARAGRAVPITLTVTDNKGKTICKASSKRGRTLCRWLPKQRVAVTVRVTSTAFRKTDTIAIYTN